jgi:hypothetical protein
MPFVVVSVSKLFTSLVFCAIILTGSLILFL